MKAQLKRGLFVFMTRRKRDKDSAPREDHSQLSTTEVKSPAALPITKSCTVVPEAYRVREADSLISCCILIRDALTTATSPTESVKDRNMQSRLHRDIKLQFCDTKALLAQSHKSRTP